MAECVGRLRDRKNFYWKRIEPPGLDVPEHGRKLLAQQVRTLGREPREVDRGKTRVSSQRAKADRRIGIDIALADLDEAAARRE